MLCGPTHLLKCVHCDLHIKMETLESGNSFGAIQWTDGRVDMPMLPRRFSLPYWYCPSCSTFQEVSKMNKVDEIEFLPRLDVEADPGWKQASDIKEPKWSEYLDGIKQWKTRLEPYPDWETTIRLLAWHHYNDRYRRKLIKQNKELHNIDTDGLQPELWGEKCIEVPQQKKMIENCKTIAKWLYEGDPDKAMDKADIFRWLGRFEHALQILNKVGTLDEFDSDAHLNRYNLLTELCKNEDPSLGVVHDRI